MLGPAQLFDRRRLLPEMSPRQRGCSMVWRRVIRKKWIARDLGIDQRTVEYHWNKIKDKFADSLQGLIGQ